MKKILHFIFYVFILTTINISSTYAAKDAMARAQFMIRQLNAELNQIKTTNTQLKNKTDEINNELKSLNKKYTRLKGVNHKNIKTLSFKINEIKDEYKAEVIAHNETKLLLKKMTRDKSILLSYSEKQKDKINICMSNNKKLFDIDKIMLSNYENKDIWDSLIQAEPFSQLSQVEIENLIDDYQYEIEDLLVDL